VIKATLNLNVMMSIAILTLSGAGCATTGKSMALGAGVGAGAGMAVGAIANPGKNGEYRTRNIIIGGALGAVTGLAAGALIQAGTDKQKDETFKAGQTQGQVVDSNGEAPKLVPAQWRAEVIEAKRTGNRYIPRHVEYVITDAARWDDGQ